MYRSSSNPGLYSHTSNFSDYPKLKSNVSGEPKPPPKVWLNSGEPSTAHAYKPAGPRSAEVNVYRHSPANPLNLDQSFNTKLNQLTDLRPSIAGGLPTAPPVRTDSVTLSPSIAIRRKPPPPIPPKPVPTVSRDDSIISPIASTPGNGDFFSLSELGSVSIGVTGLKNLGNSCYMNSTVQCLSGTEYLSRFFNGGSYRRFVNRSNPMGTKGAVAEEYARLVRDMWGGQSPFLVPSQFKNTIGQFSSQFQGHDQHDSQEFLAFLMDAIHEDLNVARRSTAIKIEEPKDDEETPDKIRQEMAWNYYRASNWSIIVDLFQGQLKSKLQCMTCMKTSTTFNPFMYLSLPIPSVGGRAVSLQDCLSKFVEPEILEGEDAWFCPSCKAKRRTKKTLSIAKLPSILLVHLKRFYFQGPFKDKVETYVDFPVDGLDVSGFMPTYMTDVGGRKERFVYDLYAISNHMGTLTSGHYTAQVYNGTRKQWHLFDDSRISSCDEASLKVDFSVNTVSAFV
ncbi:hypothetical protein DFJ73DRAFT_622487 [Zopfochytrium polystomum]|nr:hypothetical protein DFJ73DRAFT_622487 [Zopfochytrium polystomum]